MVKKILIGAAVVVLALIGIVAMQPSEFRVTRSAHVEAPAKTVFAQVNTLRNWDAWSPWAKLDPNAKNTFEGPESGPGAGFAWSGNDDVGEGRMLIYESNPPTLIRIKLDFVRPMEDTCTTVFTFSEADGETDVTWSMSGEQSFVEKAVCMFMDMDKMVGADFEKGLAQLKAVAEAAPPEAPQDAASPEEATNAEKPEEAASPEEAPEAEKPEEAPDGATPEETSDAQPPEPAPEAASPEEPADGADDAS
jgi:hypothetical protein